MNLGQYIINKRKEQGINQKDLAEKMDISPQYLNDIEHNRRNPQTKELLEKFSQHLDIDLDYLQYLAGIIPEDIQEMKLPEDKVIEIMKAFRKTKEDNI
ncbi:MAG: helix-turn-helix transcriptional regulator [Anaerolineales bacterium]|nr:helix-turn-helix transcriptional regulator [Anaerolineales bacterium]